ncbi:MAG TPA: RIP metalloprotease RseP [Bacteroidales bacterium]|nr:RIP metalloprotease RseP [Bacteroidales bacterium]HPT09064.1 RIP metalloprotease RseP [Bacteroidales bacterium]
MEIFIKVVQLLLSLSILVIFHELGHFIAAKVFKTRVEKFYLFFNPWFSLFKFKKGETEYGMGWVPLGGYVKISGMIDESMDVEQMKQPPQPWEFRTKPSWQRLIIMLGGVTVNLLLAMVIYMIMLTVWGEQYLPTANVKYGITVDSLGYEMGLRNGDQILSVDHKPVDDFALIPKTILLEEAKTIEVRRGGEALSVSLPAGSISKLIKHNSPDFISVRFPFEAARFSNGSPAEAAGMKAGDKIIGLNDSLTMYFDQFRAAIQNFKNQKVNVIVLRGADTVLVPVQVPAEGLIGVYPKGPDQYLTFKEKTYNVFTAIPAGVVKAFQGAGNYLKSMKLLFSQDKAYESVGGFISIGNIFPSDWDWHSFWSLTAFLSIMLAILNVLPIPGLDGGHVMFLLYEIVFRRKPSDKFMENAQIVGMVILFGLLIFANGQDILKLFRH